MNNRQSIDRFKSVLVQAGVKSLAPKKPSGYSRWGGAIIAPLGVAAAGPLLHSTAILRCMHGRLGGRANIVFALTLQLSAGG
jgi:hypothetical protein